MYIPGWDIALSVFSRVLGVGCHLDQVDSSQMSAVFNLDEGTLVKIFSYLPIRDLVRASQVCKLWNRLSYDRLLWKIVDLKYFYRSLIDPITFQTQAFTRFAGKVNCLDLSGFTLTEETLGALATYCRELRVLKLKSVKFATLSNGAFTGNRGQNEIMFPSKDRKSVV